MNDDYYNDNPCGCGHFQTLASTRGVWWVIGKDPGMETLSFTACFDCALIAETYGWTTDMIPTSEQLLTELDWDMAGIGTN